MASLKSKKFEVKKPVDETYVKEHRFVFSKDLSSSKIQIYQYVFPVQKFASMNLMSCIIKVAMGRKDVDIEVVKSDGSMYKDWYATHGEVNAELVEQINASILGKLYKLEIEEVSRYKEDKDARYNKRGMSELPVSERSDRDVESEDIGDVPVEQ